MRLLGAKLEMAFLKKSPKWSLLLEEEFWCVGCALQHAAQIALGCLLQGLQQRFYALEQLQNAALRLCALRFSLSNNKGWQAPAPGPGIRGL